MNCMFFNARSITHKIQEINLFTSNQKIDLAIIAESRLKENQESPFHNTIVNISAKQHLGGILAFSPSGKLKNSLMLSSGNNWQIIQFDNLIIGFGYFAPSEPFSDIELFLESIEGESNTWQEDVIIVADFNARHSQSTGDHANNSRGSKFFELISKYPIQLENAVEGLYTTSTSTGKGITDLLFSASENRYTVSDFKIHEDNLNGSDHWPLTWSLDYEFTSTFSGWNFKKLINEIRLDYSSILELNYLSIIELIETSLVEILIQRQNAALNLFESHKTTVNNLWEHILQWIESALKWTCGEKKYLDVNDIFWTPDLKAQKKQRMQNKSFILYKRYCKNLAKRKTELYLKMISDKSGETKRGDLFKMIKSGNRKKKTCFLNPKNMSEHMSYFMGTFGHPPEGGSAKIDYEILENSDPSNQSNNHLDQMLSITIEDVENALKKLANGKSAGVDGIMAEAFKFGGLAMKSVLASFYNLCGKTQITPSAWDESIIIPIFKNKGTKTEIKYYRPIALTIVGKRIFEKIIDSKLENYKEMLHTSQGGFLKKRSTLHQVYYLLELMKKNPKLIQVFLDLSAAYDMVDRRILWTMLRNRFQMPIGLIKLLRSLFDSNYSRLDISGTKSGKIHHLRGLPQGSSLSPILFNFYIDSLIGLLEQENLMLNCMDIKSNNLFFADDGNIHSNEKSTVQKLLDIAHSWQIGYGMKFAPDKCLVLSKQKNLGLKIGDNQLPEVNEAIYLGIPLSMNGFDAKKFANNCARKVESSVMQLVKNGYSSKYWSPGIKMSVYKQFIRPTAEYGLQVKIMEKSELDILESAQLKASRILLQLPWNCSIQGIRRLFCMESMQCRNKILNAKFLRNLKTLKENLQISRLTNFAANDSKSVYGEYRKRNEYLLKLVNISRESELTRKIKELRRGDIMDSKKGCKSTTNPSTRISDSIPVSKSLKLSSILFWKSEEDGEILRNLVRWRLGRIAYHQECLNCNRENLSRKHAVLCSGVDEVLFDKYEEVESFQSQNILDTILNKYMFGNHISIWKDVSWAINQIQNICLGFTI
jgi:hypothetical protein